MKSNFLKKLEETKWGQKFRQVHAGPGTAVSPTFSAVFRQTGQDINTTLKRKCDFLRNFEKTKWGQKFRQGHTGAGTADCRISSADSGKTGQKTTSPL